MTMDEPRDDRLRPAASPATAAAVRERETRWLRQIAARGPEGARAMDRVVDAYEEKILAFCVWQGNLTVAEAEDVLQDVWCRIHEKAATFIDGRLPASWIWAIVRHLVIDTHRGEWRARRRHAGEDSDDELSTLAELDARGPGVPAAQAADECVQRQLQAVSKLYPEETMALRLRHLEGWGIPELAQYLERTEVATRRFLSDARLKFRPHFLPCYELLPQ